MKNLVIGHFWWAISIACLFLTELYLGFFRGVLEYMDSAAQDFALAANGFTYWIIGLMLYEYLRKILRVRVSKVTYIVYLICGLVLIIMACLRGYVLYTLSDDVPFSSLRNAVVCQTILPLIIAFAYPWFIYWRRCNSEKISHRLLFNVGKGASSLWAGIGILRKRPARLKQSLLSFPSTHDEGVKTDRILLGKSLLNQTPFPSYIGLKNKSHYNLIAGTRTGKGVCYLSHIYATSTQPIIGIDIKAEALMMTAARRGSIESLKKHNIPQGKTTKRFKYGELVIYDALGMSGAHSDNFNPLPTYCDPSAPDCLEFINAIVNSCVTTETAQNKYFEDMPRIILKGYIIHVLTNFSKEYWNLPFVYDLITGKNEHGFLDPEKADKTLYQMLTNDKLGGGAAIAAKAILDSGADQKGALMSSVLRSISWIGDPAMRKHLVGQSDFDFRDIGVKTVIDEQGRAHKVIHTVYIVIPSSLLETYNRYFRTLISISTLSLQKRKVLPKDSTLIIIDEAAKIGHVKTLQESMGFLAGYKAQVFMVWQELEQMQKIYPQFWSTFISNSNNIFFGIRSLNTAQYIASLLGQHLKKRTNNEGTIIDGATVKNETAVDLMTPAEVMAMLSMDSNLQIVCPVDSSPLLLERLTFKPLKIVEDSRLFRAIALDGLKGHFEDY